MKYIIIFSALVFMSVYSSAQEKNSDVIIYSNNPDIVNADDVEIVVKKDGKTIKVKPESIRILGMNNNGMSNFDFFNGIEGIRGNEEINRMFRQFEGLLNDSEVFPNLPRMENRENFDEFQKEFDDFGLEKSEDENTIRLENESYEYTFKTDDGRTIIIEDNDGNDSDVTIKKEIRIQKSPNVESEDDVLSNSVDGNPIVFLNGERYYGDIDSIETSNVITIEIEKGTHATNKYGAEAKDGVVKISTK